MLDIPRFEPLATMSGTKEEAEKQVRKVRVRIPVLAKFSLVKSMLNNTLNNMLKICSSSSLFIVILGGAELYPL